MPRRVKSKKQRKSRRKTRTKHTRRSKRAAQKGGQHPEEQYDPVVSYKMPAEKLGDPDALDVTSSLDKFKEETETAEAPSETG